MVSLECLVFEVTRRCNEYCEMCMRGNPENIDMSKNIVNKVLLDNYILDIENIVFTGGEPTLNENLICYIIDLLMKNDILAKQISIVTNAKKFPKDMLESFSDYQKYCMSKHIKNKICINFSVDKFHESYPDILKEYQQKYPQFLYKFKDLPWIWKTGRAQFGEKFQYEIKPLYVQIVMGYLWIMNDLYVTARGNYETMGDGMYSDMDKIHMGSVLENSLLDILEQYGKVPRRDEEEFKRLIYKARYR